MNILERLKAGLGVGVHGDIEADEQVKVVGKVVQNLMRQGFNHDDIAVLTCRGLKSSVFSDARLQYQRGQGA